MFVRAFIQNTIEIPLETKCIRRIQLLPVYKSIHLGNKRVNNTKNKVNDKVVNWSTVFTCPTIHLNAYKKYPQYPQNILVIDSTFPGSIDIRCL